MRAGQPLPQGTTESLDLTRIRLVRDHAHMVVSPEVEDLEDAEVSFRDHHRAEAIIAVVCFAGMAVVLAVAFIATAAGWN